MRFFPNLSACRIWLRRRARTEMQRKRNSRRRSRAFSLVEVLMVVAIILILSALVMARYRESRRTALEGAVVSSLKAIHANQESYRHLNKTYTSDFKELGLVDEVTGSLNQLPLERAAMILPPSMLPFFTDLHEQQQEEEPSKSTGKTKKGGRGGITGPSGGGSSGGGGRGGKRGGGGAGTGGPPPAGGTPGSGGQTGQPTPPGGTPAPTPSPAPAPPPSGGGTSGGLGGSSSGGSATSSRCTSGGSCSQITRHKYIFTMELLSTEAFRCTAEPVSDRISSNFFYMDQTGTIRREFGKPATAESKPL
jgi:prepilin-type N-terminal cleavage/methylation domain-containing protein